MPEVVVVIGPGQIGQAIARRVGVGKHILLADMRLENANAAATVMENAGRDRPRVRPGDIVWFTPSEKHWHGASSNTAMTHIAIAESLDGMAVDWLEKVSDEQYRRVPE